MGPEKAPCVKFAGETGVFSFNSHYVCNTLQNDVVKQNYIKNLIKMPPASKSKITSKKSIKLNQSSIG